MDDTRTPLPIGTVLHERYRIEEHLGGGGFGLTYRATDLGFEDRTVVIKEYYPRANPGAATLRRTEDGCTLTLDPHQREEHQREIRRVLKEGLHFRSFQQPHLVSVQEAFLAHNTAYLVMGYVEGATLEALLKAQGRLAPALVHQMLEQVGSALHYMHTKQHTLHLDVKPANIIWSGAQFVLIDFGEAKTLSAGQNPSQQAERFSLSSRGYTPAYAAPEQLDHIVPKGPYTDIYSLGVTAYESVTGELPPSSMQRQLKGATLELGSVPAGRLRTLLGQALTVRPDDRPASIMAWLEPSGETVKTDDKQSQERNPVQPVRGPNRMAQAGIVGLLVLLLALLWWVSRNPAAPPEVTEAAPAPVDSSEAAPMDTLAAPSDSVAPSPEEETDQEVITPPAPETVYVATPQPITPPTTSIGMTFVQIPAGSFRMGSSSSEAGSDEQPVHEVRISRGFELGKYEVTQAEWEAVMGSNPSWFPGANRPVEQVSWEDAQAFIRRLNARGDGYTYRLPTEAEWEYACRAGTPGERYGSLDAVAWHAGNSGDRTHDVGSKQPNAWGLHDCLGNVYEWVGDRYGKDYYGESRGNDPPGPNNGYFRVCRGGSWYDSPKNVRAAFRIYYDPALRFYFRGFRVARTVNL
jgi:formylglycine-generating enzyme required for sulfatase activity